MNDRINLDDNNIDIQEEPKNKDLSYNLSFGQKVNNWYYSLVDKLHLRSFTNFVDKYFPSIYLFAFLILLIIVAIILLIIFAIPNTQTYNMSINLDGKTYSGFYNVALTGKGLELLSEPKNAKGLIKFNASANSLISVKLTINNNVYTNTIKADKENLVLNIKSKTNTETPITQTDNIYSFVFATKNGSLSKDGTIKVDCDNYSQEYNVTKGFLSNVKIPCNSINVIANIENVLPANQNCSPGVCKILFNDAISAPVLDSLPKNKLVVYVNNSDATPAKGINVEIRNKDSQELIDNGLTKDFGSFTIDLSVGKYLVNISDPNGKYASQQKDVEVTSGTMNPIIFSLSVLAIGSININFNVEDSNYVFGNLYLKDINNRILETKRFDSNVDLNFPISVQGTYFISANLDSSFTNLYLQEKDLQVDYDLTSGIKESTIDLRKVNTFTDKNIVVQVFDGFDKTPIPFSKIYFEDYEGKQLTNIGNAGFVTTDYNGVYSKIFPLGDYVVKVKTFNWQGQNTFSVKESKSITLESENVPVYTNAREYKLEICISEKNGNNSIDLNDANVEVYSTERGLESTFYIDSKNCVFDNIKGLNNVYIHVIKDGYYEYYSQAVLLNTDFKFDIVLSKIVEVDRVQELMPKFLGIYKSPELNKDEETKLEENQTYYYAFSLRVPQAKAEKKLKFVGVSGDLKDENANISKLVTKDVLAPGYSLYYKNYSSTNAIFDKSKLLPTELNENDYSYSAKSFESTYKFDTLAKTDLELIYFVKVNLTNNFTKENDNVIFNYGFGYDDNSEIKLNKLIYKLGTYNCTTMCVDAYHDNESLKSIGTLPLSGNIYGKITFGKMFDKQIMIYNKGENAKIEKSEDIKDLFNTFELGKLTLTDISGESKDYEINKNNPIYFNSLNDFNVDFGSYINFDFNYRLLTADSSSINFRLYDSNFQTLIDENSYNIKPEETEQLDVKGLPKYIVPYISNELRFNVSDKDNIPKVNAEVRYYNYENGNWYFKNKDYTDNQGNITIKSESIVNGGKIKIVVLVDNYKPSENVIDSGFGLDLPNQLEHKVTWPQDAERSAKQINNLKNNSEYDYAIDNFNLGFNFGSKDYDKILENAINLKDILSKHTDDSDYKIISANKNFKLFMSYNLNELKNSETGRLNLPLVLSFNFYPKGISETIFNTIKNNLDVNFFYISNLNLTLDLNGIVSMPNCLQYSITNIGENATPLEKITFVDESEKKIQLNIMNNCNYESSIKQFSFSDLNLIVKSNAYNINFSISEQTDKPFFTKLLNSGELNNVSLNTAKQSGEIYIYYITLKVDKITPQLREYAGEGTINFDLKGKYQTLSEEANNAIVNGVSSNKNNVLTIDFKTLEQCLTFGLNPIYNTDTHYFVEGTDVLRLPYYLKGELSANGNIVVDADGTNANVPGLNVYNNQYEIDKLPLLLENKCDKDFTVIINKDLVDGFELVNDPKMVLQESFHPNKFNSKIALKANEKKEYNLIRGTTFSGALFLDLNIINDDGSFLVKRLKVNVESSLENRNFVINPFDIENNQPSYYNEYYPENLENIKSEAFALYDIGFSGINHSTNEADSYNSKFYIDNLPISPKNLWASYSTTSDGENFIGEYYKNCLDSYSYYSSYNCEFLTRMIIFANYEKRLANNQCIDGWCYNDDSIGLRYFIYNYNFFSDLYYDFLNDNISDSFINLETSDSDFGQNEKYSETAFNDKLKIYSDKLGFMINGDLPYFINFGLSFFQGDSGSNRYIHAPTYCPLNTEPVKIYLDTAFQGCVDHINDVDRRILEPLSFDDGTVGYAYNNDIDLCGGAGSHSDGYATSKILTVCRLKKENFPTSIDRPYAKDITVDRVKNNVVSPKYIGQDTSNCFAGGITGESVKPKINYDLEIQDLNCENTNCNMVQLSNYIINKSKDLENGKTEFSIKSANLLLDNYGLDSYAKYKTTKFLVDSQYNVNYKTYDGKEQEVITTGKYFVKVIKTGEKDLDVYLYYQTYTLPDHLFYYMPFSGIVGDNLGTSVSSRLAIFDNLEYPLNNDKLPLFSYSINNNLNKLSDNSLPIALYGAINFGENRLSNSGDIYFANNYVSVRNKLTNNSFNLPKNTYFAKVFVKRNNNWYPGELFFDVNYDLQNNIITINNNNESYSVIFVSTDNSGNFNNGTPISTVGTINDIFTEIGNSNMCYVLKDNSYIYYWNIFKILNDYENN